ncbi:hypothetical protein MSG28_010908 [Choristoneura fumiferana]|uniref:Uncharacterized protein n=1 Tax=Choristoneura fumiferana TaxID=7141 RepID=A0ACC0KQ06_CHOFU|nr:hypothetical protein MSG28_010908 [Choristoneura fumiferana]
MKYFCNYIRARILTNNNSSIRKKYILDTNTMLLCNSHDAVSLYFNYYLFNRCPLDFSTL